MPRTRTLSTARLRRQLSLRAVRIRPVGVALNICITAAFVVAAAPGFTPAGPRPAEDVIAKGSRGSGGSEGSGVSGGPAMPIVPGPEVQDVRDLPSRNTTAPEDPASSRVITELDEFYTEYAAVQLDRQQKLGREPVTVPEVAPDAAAGMTPGVQDIPIEPSPAPAESTSGPPDPDPDPVDSPEAVATASEPAPEAGTNEAGPDQQSPTAVGSPREGE